MTLDLDVNGFSPDTFGATRVSFSATTTIDRNDFGVSFNAPIPGLNNAMLLSDSVAINLDVGGGAAERQLHQLSKSATSRSPPPSAARLEPQVCQLGPGSDIEFAEHLDQVVLHGALANEETSGDFPISEALRCKPGDLGFLRGELGF